MMPALSRAPATLKTTLLGAFVFTSRVDPEMGKSLESRSLDDLPRSWRASQLGTQRTGACTHFPRRRNRRRHDWRAASDERESEKSKRENTAKDPAQIRKLPRRICAVAHRLDTFAALHYIEYNSSTG
jgi:hypothetical protein